MSAPIRVKRDMTPVDLDFDFGGRSYVSMSHRNSISFSSPTVRSGMDVNQESADLANLGVLDETANSSYSDERPSRVDLAAPEPLHLNEYGAALADESAPLIGSKLDQKSSYSELGSAPDLEMALGLHALPPEQPEKSGSRNLLARALLYLPAVFLGLLLNILDALSYGMIMFPIGDSLFAQMAPAGLSMFYISTVISQLVYSLGGSAFKAGAASEMIEVTPFFHSMALSISAEMAGASKNAILATVIVTYALLSVVTGVTFFLLGKFHLGSLIGFFPRHILVGCIGGVGYFLVVTGIEVLSRLEGGLAYNWDTLMYLFGNPTTLAQWVLPLALTTVLILLHHRIHHSLLVPVFFICVFALFHVVVAAWTGVDLEAARNAGWVFPAVVSKEPWYAHYQLFRFNLVNWVAIARQFPSMLALTFFGILHVPINVPALAVRLGMDQFDVDRELVAHGYSNAISGLLGSIQNYLVYTNSVLFIKAGADDRMAGVMLAAATAGIMVVGPVVIGYIPVCVVGALIYLLGYELLKEAIWDTWGKLRKIEYTTILIIVVMMGAWDFVHGVLVGILMACLTFVVQAARRPVVQDIYTGVVARSTVLRHPKQQEFLKHVGNQICVIKLEGTIFFGSIGRAEKSIGAIFDQLTDHGNPIKYMILDMKGVYYVDFSAAEGFRRILNLTNFYDTQLIISSVQEDDDTYIALRDAGLWDVPSELKIQLFSTLNDALEWCENSFLKTYYTLQTSAPSSSKQIRGIRVASGSEQKKPLVSQGFDIAFGTPRTSQVYQAATKSVRDEQKIQNKFYRHAENSFKKQPLPLMMITFSGLSKKDETFWCRLAPFFTREAIPEGTTFYDTKAKHARFFILESGLVKSVSHFESDRELVSSILPNTAFGDLLEISDFHSTIYTAVNGAVAWYLTLEKVKELLKTENGQLVYNELLMVQTKLVRERFDTLSSNLVISA